MRTLRERRKMIGNAVMTLVLALGGLFMIIPFLWMISTSLKDQGQVFLYPPRWIPHPIRWSNYRSLLETMPFGRFFLNTAIVSVTCTLSQIVTSSMAAYAFARIAFPSRNALFFLYLATMMVPGQVIVIPQFILMKYLNWIDTYQALILPHTFSAFGVFLMRQFFLTIPQELEDAASIDGCSPMQTYLKIMLPLSKPAVAAFGVFSFMWQWNSFLWPLIVTNSLNMKTLTVGLRALQGMFYTDYTVLMAGSTISLLPIILAFILGQRFFVEGITLTGFGGR